MTRAEYWEAVSAELKHLLPPEKEKVRRELDGHLEDCIEDLTAGGYAPEAAEARAVAVMGDPAETGRAINAQYSPFWLFVQQAAFMLCLLAALFLMRPAVNTVQTLRYRSDTAIEAAFSESTVLPMAAVDEKMSIAGDVLECRGMAYFKAWRTEEPTVRMIFCQYVKWPWGDIQRDLWDSVTFETSAFSGHRGGEHWYDNAYWRTDEGLTYYTADVPVTYGEAFVRVRCSYRGQYAEMTVPLDWTGVEP